jgi:CheY-like chemotaxis protein
MTGLAENNLANEVVAVHDGSEALDYLNYRGKFDSRALRNPAVVLLDLKLLKINGLEVLRQIRNDVKLKLMPVVILTSSHEEKDVIEGHKRICRETGRFPCICGCHQEDRGLLGCC